MSRARVSMSQAGAALAMAISLAGVASAQDVVMRRPLPSARAAGVSTQDGCQITHTCPGQTGSPTPTSTAPPPNFTDPGAPLSPSVPELTPLPDGAFYTYPAWNTGPWQGDATCGADYKLTRDVWCGTPAFDSNHAPIPNPKLGGSPYYPHVDDSVCLDAGLPKPPTTYEGKGANCGYHVEQGVTGPWSKTCGWAQRTTPYVCQNAQNVVVDNAFCLYNPKTGETEQVDGAWQLSEPQTESKFIYDKCTYRREVTDADLVAMDYVQYDAQCINGTRTSKMGSPCHAYDEQGQDQGSVGSDAPTPTCTQEYAVRIQSCSIDCRGYKEGRNGGWGNTFIDNEEDRAEWARNSGGSTAWDGWSVHPETFVVQACDWMMRYGAYDPTVVLMTQQGYAGDPSYDHGARCCETHVYTGANGKHYGRADVYTPGDWMLQDRNLGPTCDSHSSELTGENQDIFWWTVKNTDIGGTPDPNVQIQSCQRYTYTSVTGRGGN